MASDTTADSEWEYNCPQYVDFTAPLSDENADDWFDYDHENGEGSMFAKEEEKSSEIEKCTDEEQKENIKEKPNNLVTSLEEWNAGRTESNTTSAAGGKRQRSSHRKNKKDHRNGFATSSALNVKKSGTPNSKRRKVSTSNSHDNSTTGRVSGPTRSKGPLTRRSADSVPASQASALNRSNRSVCSLDEKRTTRSSDNKAPTVKKLTVPTTPMFMKRMQRSVAGAAKCKKTTEQKEMEQVELLRKELEAKRKISKNSFKKLKAVVPQHSVHSTTELTKPEEFHFATDSRVKAHGMETRQDKKDFVSQLRCPTEQAKSNHTGPTRPQPFNLSSDARKRKRPEDLSNEESGYKFESVAEKLIKFSARTPDRFRTRPANKPMSPCRGKAVKSELTVPHTPNFETRNRKRQVHVMSAVEKENQEVEDIKKNQFKAHPVKQKILENPNMGVKKVPSKPTTEAVGFSFECDVRPKTTHDTSQEKKYEFHARPVPKAILEGVVGVKPKAELQITVPESPAFALKKRIREKPQEKSVLEEELAVIKSQPVPHTGVPFHPRLEHRVTVPEPFSFEERDKLTHQKREDRIQQELEEKAKPYEFKAQPLPDDSPDVLPAKQVRHCTQPQPFNLESDIRGAMRAESWSSKLEEELRQQRSQGAFKARPNNVIYQDPFVPKKSEKNLTDVEEFSFNTERRMTRRQEQEADKKQQEAEEETLRQQREEQRLEEERAQVSRLRAAMVHKAQPVAHYRQVEVMPSTKPLTIAQTPQFATKTRSRKSRV